MEIKIKILNKNAVIPKYKHQGDGAQDLYAVSCNYNTKYNRFEYGLGFSTEFSNKYRARICPRSSNTKTKAYIPNSPGLIDSNYRGEWFVMYKNIDGSSIPPYEVGDAVAQVYFEDVITPQWTVVDDLSDSERGSDGGLIRDNLNFK